MCRKPLSIRHEALHEVHWAFIAAVTRTTSSKHPNHASNSFLYYSGPVKENFIFISKKRRHEMMMKKKNFPSLRRKKRLEECYRCMKFGCVCERIGERVLTLNCPLVIDLTHILCIVIFSLSLALTRGRRLYSKKMHETHKHTQMATISRPATKPAEHDFFLGKMYMRTCNKRQQCVCASRLQRTIK